ncbi:glycosyltransferase family 4 protein [Anaerolineales bacterium HSG6]|nr:glycosyltransferase family 4 protein [Anaerolineales bacterium HSG6]MDM8532139.1 glycosyltransferase family 4 protein [Anaerolineales bacterium HSG25]
MRVLIINYEFPPIGAGGGKASQKIAASLVEMGHTVRVVTSRPTQLYSLFGNISLVLGIFFWIYLTYIWMFLDKDLSDHGFTLLGTLLLLTGFILRNTGLTWELISPIRGLQPVEFIDGVEVQRIPVLRQRQDYCSTFEMGTFLLSGLWYSFWQVREFEPDVVHIFFGIPDGPIGWFLKRVYGLPYLISLRGADVPSHEVKRFAKQYKVLRPFIRRLWHDADAVVSVSSGLREYAVDTAPDVPIEVISNAIDLSVFIPPRARNHDDPVQLVFVGRFNAFKNVEMLLEAISILKEKGINNVELRLIGDGSRRSNLERLTTEKGLTKQVQFSGWVDRTVLVKIYQEADLFVTATTWEGMPNTVLEAMACGLPIVATKASGLSELVRDDENGYLVALNDSDSLADRLAELVDNPYQRQRMGKESRKIAEQEFAWEHITEQYVQVYKRVCQK